MSVIWRFELPQGQRDLFLSVPKGSRYLKCVMKDGQPQLYFMVHDPAAECGDVMFYVVPTGVELTELEARATYLDSFVINEGGMTLVFHLLLEATNV